MISSARSSRPRGRHHEGPPVPVARRPDREPRRPSTGAVRTEPRRRRPHRSCSRKPHGDVQTVQGGPAHAGQIGARQSCESLGGLPRRPDGHEQPSHGATVGAAGTLDVSECPDQVDSRAGTTCSTAVLRSFPALGNDASAAVTSFDSQRGTQRHQGPIPNRPSTPTGPTWCVATFAARGIGDERVLEAMGAVPPAEGVSSRPASSRSSAYADRALPLGFRPDGVTAVRRGGHAGGAAAGTDRQGPRGRVRARGTPRRWRLGWW